MGEVVSASIERGSVVKTGDVLAKLDERQPKLSLAEAAASVGLAKARLVLAKNEQERNKPLAEKGGGGCGLPKAAHGKAAAREAELAASEARQALATEDAR